MKSVMPWLVIGGLAAAMGAALAWQRLEMRPLRAEIESLRVQQEAVGRLRKEQERLLAQQVSETELQRLRADREAIGRLRREIDEARARSEAPVRPAAAAAAERFAPGVEMPATEWRNAGAATPAAALETVLWAAAGGDVEAFARLIQFDEAGRKAAVALLQELPPEMRARYASPEQWMAFLSIKDIPTGAATVASWSQSKGPLQPVSLTLAATDGKSRRVTLILERKGEEWKLRATEAAVAKYATALRGPAGGKE